MFNSLMSQPRQRVTLIHIERCLLAGVYEADFIRIHVRFFRRSAYTIHRIIIITASKHDQRIGEPGRNIHGSRLA